VTYKSIDLSVTEGVARLTLNQPELGNPFNAAFCEELAHVANALSGRNDLRAVLITGRGKFFSVGGDIRMFADDLDNLPDNIRTWTAGLHMGIARLQRLNAPLIASVHATCMGGGVALIAGCDMVLAGKSARFGAAYPQIGYTCDAGASFVLSARLGIARTRRFFLFNEMLDAQTAAGIGLIDQLVDDAVLAEETEKVVRQLASGPTRAFGAVRKLVNQSLRQPFEAQLEDEAQALVTVAGSADAREGITAFVEKRKPKFQGK
jgi:2-(1,2-epoxy-1,2-dihydrophenyl)acetyl-CoA isomerase